MCLFCYSRVHLHVIALRSYKDILNYLFGIDICDVNFVELISCVAVRLTKVYRQERLSKYQEEKPRQPRRRRRNS